MPAVRGLPDFLAPDAQLLANPDVTGRRIDPWTTDYDLP